MKIVNLDHMVLTVNDLEKSKNFYHEIVGLPVITEQTDASPCFSCLRKLSVTFAASR